MSAAQLQLASAILGPLVEEVVFVGGATIHLWQTEPGAPPARATDDVDVVCDVHTRGAYYALGERLRERGLSEAVDEKVVCRWRHPPTGLVIDVMPVEGDVLGFTNTWYPLGIETAVEYALPDGTTIWAVAPAVVVATKLEAWLGRGHGDILRSTDVYDILVLVDGRPELADEVAAQREDVRRCIADELGRLMEDAYLDYAILDVARAYGRVAEERAVIVRERLDRLVASALG